MTWRVQLSRQAAQTFRRLAPPQRRRLEAAIDAFANDLWPSGKLVKAIQGTKEAFLRYRVGDYRILYEVFDQDRTVLILGIMHRRDLEDWLRWQR